MNLENGLSSDEYFKQAIASFQAGRLNDAERQFKEVLRHQPKHVAALNLLSVVLTHLKRYAEAETYVKLALEVNSNSDSSLYNYGIILKSLHREIEALEYFSRALSINATVAETWNNRGTVLNQLKRYDDAVVDFNKAIKLQPTYSGAYYNKGKSLTELERYDEALVAYDQALALKPDLADAWVGRGNVLNESKRYDEALLAFDKALALKHDHAAAWLGRGNVLNELKRYDEASLAFNKTLALKPDPAEVWLGRGNTFNELKRYDEAFAAYDEALALKPDLAEAWVGRGYAFVELKRYDEASAAYDKALALKPDLADAWLGRGNVFFVLKRYDESFAAYGNALALKPDLANAWLGRGNAFNGLKRYDEAFAAYDKALALKPDLAEAWVGRGYAFVELKRYDEASAAYDKALALKPELADAWHGRGNVFFELKRYDEASAAYDKALALKPELADAWLGRGNVFFELKRYDEASAAYDKALALKPEFADAWLGRGNVFFELKRYDDAFGAYDKALVLMPDLAEAWLGRGNVFNKLKRHEEATGAYAKALKVKPQYPFAKGSMLHQKMLCCDWKEVNYLIEEIERDIASGKLSAGPFGWQGIAKSERSLQLCAKLYNENNFPANINISTRRPLANNNSKIRIGYLSGEFREQATSHLLVGVLECHDNTHFEIYAFDNGWDDQSEIRRRINHSVHGVINIQQLSDPSAVAAICENQIDILINLNGYFGEHRTRVFAQRPAPIQVNYLGFPGTLGASYIDYIIADQHVIPPDHNAFYTEKVVYLPNCYQANDRKREIGTRFYSREECGLPEKGIVFSCFNNNYKIMPDIFDCWMRILKQVEGSVFWLLEDNQAAAGNLRKEAVARGVDAERLIFAKRIPPPEHMARHRLADLFLDTLPYNAHTTASDALWAGLPVLTCIGETFAGRVAASLLNAIRLPELITATLEAYEQMAIELAAHPEKLAIIKRKLAENRLTTPLFDTKLFTKHIEAAYSAMYERHQASLAPDHIVIPN